MPAPCSSWGSNEPLRAAGAARSSLCVASAPVSRHQPDRGGLRPRLRPADAVRTRGARPALAFYGVAAVSAAVAVLERPWRGAGTGCGGERRGAARARGHAAAEWLLSERAAAQAADAR